MQIIEPTAWRSQPWRNGAGVTHELVRWPAGDAFAVRISVAEITAPAPFSAFAGYRRWLYLLDGGPVTLARGGADVILGGPVTLARGGEDVILAEPGDGLAFAGEDRIAATAVARPSRDLNFMVSEALPARAAILRGGAREELAGAVVAVVAIAGEVVVAGAAGADRRVLGRHGCAWDTGARIAVELAPGALAAALVIER